MKAGRAVGNGLPRQRLITKRARPATDLQMTTTTAQNNTITLEASEMLNAASAGVMRTIESIKRGFKPRYGAGTDDAWQLSVEGALAECAVAKALGIYWAGKGAWNSVDVGKCVQVRSTDYESGRLIVHPDDKDDQPFVLVVGSNGVYRIAGWLYGRECKQQEWWGSLSKDQDRPAFNVPQSALRPFAELRKVLA